MVGECFVIYRTVVACSPRDNQTDLAGTTRMRKSSILPMLGLMSAAQVTQTPVVPFTLQALTEPSVSSPETLEKRLKATNGIPS